MFHVNARETRSFAQAKAPEQRIEQIFDAGPPGNAVDRQPRNSQALRRPAPDRPSWAAARQRLLRFGQQIMLAAIERQLVALGQQLPQPAQPSSRVKFAKPFAGNRRDRAGHRPAQLQIGLWRDLDQPGMMRRIFIRSQPEQQVRLLGFSLGALDPDRFDHIVRIRAGRPYRPARTACRRSRAALRSRRAWSRQYGVTMAFSLCANALTRLDFPAFGGPATTTLIPSRNGSTRGASTSSAMSAGKLPGCPAEIAEPPRHPPRRHNRSPPRPAPTAPATDPASHRAAPAAPRRPGPWPSAAAARFPPPAGRPAPRPRSGRSGHWPARGG